MAAPLRRTDPSVKALLLEEGYRFNFFQAVRLLHRTHPDRDPVGRAGDPEREAVHFYARNSLNFPASEIYEIRENEAGQADMSVNFMGLTGLSGVLPQHYTALLQECQREGDTALIDFLNIFNHRLLSFFFRAWQKYRLQHLEEAAQEDPCAQYLYAFIGLGTAGLKNRLSLPDNILLFYSGLLARQPRSALNLECFLEDVFRAPVKIAQFVGRWLDLEAQDCSRLGAAGMRNELRSGIILGQRVWDRQTKFRIAVGPLTLEKFSAFLPQQKLHLALVQLTRLFVGYEFDFEVQLILRADEVPFCMLNGAAPCAPRLGWNTWLKTMPLQKDMDDVLIPVRSNEIIQENIP